MGMDEIEAFIKEIETMVSDEYGYSVSDTSEGLVWNLMELQANVWVDMGGPVSWLTL